MPSVQLGNGRTLNSFVLSFSWYVIPINHRGRLLGLHRHLAPIQLNVVAGYPCLSLTVSFRSYTTLSLDLQNGTDLYHSARKSILP